VGCCCSQCTFFTSAKVQMLTQMKWGLGGMLLFLTRAASLVKVFYQFKNTNTDRLLVQKYKY
jgi:hypothetical protein